MRRGDEILQVLAVDDEPLILFCISKGLKGKAEVKAVSSAEEALDEIKSHHYDLCILDIYLPGMTGLEAMRKIQKLSPTTKVAIMSGSQLDEAMKRQIEAGVCAFIEKPFELSRIKEIANRARLFSE